MKRIGSIADYAIRKHVTVHTDVCFTNRLSPLFLNICTLIIFTCERIYILSFKEFQHESNIAAIQILSIFHLTASLSFL